MNNNLETAIDRIDELQKALIDALQLAREGWSYDSVQYFRKKWKIDEEIEKLEVILNFNSEIDNQYDIKDIVEGARRAISLWCKENPYEEDEKDTFYSVRQAAISILVCSGGLKQYIKIINEELDIKNLIKEIHWVETDMNCTKPDEYKNSIEVWMNKLKNIRKFIIEGKIDA